MKDKYFEYYNYVMVYITSCKFFLKAVLVDPFVNRRRARFVLNSFLDSLDFSMTDRSLPSEFIDALIVPKEPISVSIPNLTTDQYHGGTFNISELYTLGYIVKASNALRVLEIGTFRGRTTLLFAENSNENSHIFTIDLEQNRCNHQVGELYKGNQLSRKIYQIYGDTTSYDFKDHCSLYDFVWVDACHDYEYVKNDTTVALKCAKPGGYIAWHDYRLTSQWAGVTKFIREIRNNKNFEFISHVKGTSIVVAKLTA